MIPMMKLKGDSCLVRLPLNGNARDMQGFHDFTYQLTVAAGRVLPMPILNFTSTSFANANGDGSSSVCSTFDGKFDEVWNDYAGDISVEFFMYWISGSFSSPVNFQPPVAISSNAPFHQFGFQAFGNSFRIFSNGTTFTDIASDTYTNKWYWFRFRKQRLNNAFGNAGLFVDYAPVTDLKNIKTATHGWGSNTAAYNHEMGVGSYAHGQNNPTTSVVGHIVDVRVYKYLRMGPPSF
jgi:hypothetical protein